MRKKISTQLLRECWSFLTKLMTCQNLQNKLLNITVLFIWYIWRVLKKCHSPSMASSISFWRVLVSVHSPFWRVFEKNGFPHCYMIIVKLIYLLSATFAACETKTGHKAMNRIWSIINDSFQLELERVSDYWKCSQWSTCIKNNAFNSMCFLLLNTLMMKYIY